MIKSLAKTVTTAGTAEALSSSSVHVAAITIVANAANTGNIFVGDLNVSSANSPPLAGTETLVVSREFERGPGDLALIWIDASVNGEGVKVWYEPWGVVPS